MRRFALLLVLSPAASCTPLPDRSTGDDGAAWPLAALRPVRLDEKSMVQLDAEPLLAATRYVSERRPLLGLDERDELEAIDAALGIDGRLHVRLRHTVDGVPVHGSQLVAHAADGAFLSVSGNLAVGVDRLGTQPATTEDDALDVAGRRYAEMSKEPDAPLAFTRRSVERTILPSEAGARLAYRVELHTELQAGIEPGAWNAFVDAETGELLHFFNAIDALSQASGPGGNAKVARSWNGTLDVEPWGNAYRMETARLRTANLHGATSGAGQTVTGPLGAIGDSAINDAHGFAETTLEMLAQWFGLDSIDGQGFPIRSRVHYGSGYENAFWNGQEMTYGDGGSYFFPLSGGLDIVAHEIHHGFTQLHSGLYYGGESGGMNESFSDVAGTAAEFFAEGAAADWTLGEDTVQATGGWLRAMCHPALDGHSIEHADDLTAGMDVHFSSGVFNRAFCRAAKRLSSGSAEGVATAGGVRRAATAWFAANQGYWVSSSTFAQGCQGIVDAAVALGFEESETLAIRDSFADVGVYCAGAASPPPPCDQTITAATGTLASPNHPAGYPANFARTWCLKPPTGAVRLTFTAFDTEPGYDFVEIRSANGAVLSKSAGTLAPAPAAGTKLYLTFTSDATVQKSGWKASWEPVANDAPQVSLTAPATGATLGGAVTVTADAFDTDGTVAKVVFGLPDGTFAEDGFAPFAVVWDSSSVPDAGSHTITARAVDDVGSSSALASRAVAVQNGEGCLAGTFAAPSLPLAIPDAPLAGIVSTVVVDGAGRVGSLALSLDAVHPYQGDLRVALVAPDGSEQVVWNRHGGAADDLLFEHVALTAFDGLPAAGPWRLKVQDFALEDEGQLRSWSLRIVGDCD